MSATPSRATVATAWVRKKPPSRSMSCWRTAARSVLLDDAMRATLTERTTLREAVHAARPHGGALQPRTAGVQTLGLEPASAPEEDHQQDERDELGADPEADERGPAGDMADHPAEVLAEEPGDEGQRQKYGRDHGELLHDHVEPV